MPTEQLQNEADFHCPSAQKLPIFQGKHTSPIHAEATARALDLFLDYANNVKLYPAFQRYFREQKPRTLAVWGRFDPFFVPAGAKSFARDNPNATVHLIDEGHFALETQVVKVAEIMRSFLAS